MMKSILITFITLFLLLNTTTGQEWEVLNQGTGNTEAFDFINKDTGWIAGDRGIIRTNDGGENWVPIFNGEIAFTRIDFINDSIGWAIEKPLNNQTAPYNILKTLNGGQDWVQQEKVFNLITLLAISENMVYAIGDSSILKTNDGGLSWEDITPISGSGFNSASFYNGDTGIVVTRNNGEITNLIYRTFDGGKTWGSLTLYEFYRLFNIQFINDTTCYFLARDWQNDNDYLVCKTSDFFSSWSVLYKNNNPLRFCHFYDSKTAIALIDSNEILSSEDIDILKTTDGGLTWNSTEHMPLIAGLSINFNQYTNQNVTYIFCYAGSFNLLLKSVDQGNTWTLNKRMLPFNDVHFINKETGFLVGGISGFHHSWGALLFTQDGGKTWNSLLNLEANPTEFYFLNESKAFLTCEGGLGFGLAIPDRIYTTIDGGYSWKRYNTVYDDFLIRFRTMFFLNDSVGWFFYEYDPSFKTIDGGQTWEEFLNLRDQSSEFELLINSLFFTDENRGYLVGDGGEIVKFSGVEELVVIESGTTLPLNKILFEGRNTGWIAGGYIQNDFNDYEFHPIFLKSIDGGENWDEITGIEYLFHDFYFKDTLQGWAIGEDSTGHGMVLETIDGGNNWTAQIDSLSAPLNGIHYKDGTIWAVGNNGLILKMIDTNYTSAKAEIANNASLFQLQNFPNPFHSKTIICYQLPESSEVEMNVYDLLGQKIATLLKEQQSAGKYKQDWNAENWQPGIYICELRTGQGRQAMKMIKIE